MDFAAVLVSAVVVVVVVFVIDGNDDDPDRDDGVVLGFCFSALSGAFVSSTLLLCIATLVGVGAAAAARFAGCVVFFTTAERLLAPLRLRGAR